MFQFESEMREKLMFQLEDSQGWREGERNGEGKRSLTQSFVLFRPTGGKAICFTVCPFEY